MKTRVRLFTWVMICTLGVLGTTLGAHAQSITAGVGIQQASCGGPPFTTNLFFFNAFPGAFSPAMALVKFDDTLSTGVTTATVLAVLNPEQQFTTFTFPGPLPPGHWYNFSVVTSLPSNTFPGEQLQVPVAFPSIGNASVYCP